MDQSVSRREVSTQTAGLSTGAGVNSMGLLEILNTNVQKMKPVKMSSDSAIHRLLGRPNSRDSSGGLHRTKFNTGAPGRCFLRKK